MRSRFRSLIVQTIAVVLLSIVLFPVEGAAVQATTPLWQRLQALVKSGESLRIAEVMAAQGEPNAVATLYSSAVTSLYRADDLRAVIVVAQKGIDYCLTQAIEAGKRTDTTLEEALRCAAKAIAYNLGSYTWPGWDEPGIKIQPEDVTLGFQAAKLNLRLGEELARGPEPMSRAHWLLGAHDLAAGNYSEAIESFRRAAQLSATAGNRAEQLLAQGFEAITKVVGKVPNSQGEAELTRIKNALLSESPRDAQFWIGQLDTAYRAFAGNRR